MGLEVKNLLGLNEPITKLLEMVSQSVGTLYKPIAIRKEARAESYKKIELAKADIHIKILEADGNLQLEERTKHRIIHQEMIRQINIEETVGKSFKYLGTKVSSQPVDRDWLNRFFQKTQDISNEEIQEVWAKILANKVTEPNTVSIRTLNVLSNLTPKEAQVFQKASSLASGYSRIWKLKSKAALEEFGLKYHELMLLRDAGLIYEGDNICYTLEPDDIKECDDFYLSHTSIGKTCFEIQFPKKNNQLFTKTQFQFQQIPFTRAGQELCRIVNREINSEYVKQLIIEKKKQGLIITKVECPKGEACTCK